MKKIGLSLTIAVFALFFLHGCVQKGPILVDNIWYRAPEGTVAGTAKVVVGISPFKDERGTSPSVLGKRSVPSSHVGNDLVVQGTVADLVTSRFEDALKARGITVKVVPEWDLTGEHVSAKGADIVIGGEIQTLWIGVVSKTVKVNYKTDVQIRVSAADAVEKKLFRRLTLNTTMEREDVSFSPARVEKMLSEAISSTIDQLLSDEEFEKGIQ